MDLLLDINVAVDICAKRPAYYQDADLALAKCRQEGGRLWLYAGSVQTLEYVTRAELNRPRRQRAGRRHGGDAAFQFFTMSEAV